MRSLMSTMLVLSVLLGWTEPALAQGAVPAPSAAAPLDGLEACRGIAVDAARLACYDRVAGELSAAQRTGAVVVVAKEQVRAARRQAFGFNLPSLDLFRGRGEPLEPVDRASLVLARASVDADGKWVLRMEDGQVWRQTDGERLGRSPRAGSKAEIRRAAIGSYLMNIDGQRAIRVRREQ